MDAEKIIKYIGSKAQFGILKREWTDETICQAVDNRVTSVETSQTEMYTIKLWNKNAQAIVTSSVLNKELVDKALANAKANAKEEYFYGLPHHTSYQNVPKYDRRIAQFSPDDLCHYMKDLIDDTKDESVALSQARISATRNESALYTTEGNHTFDKSTLYALSASAVAKKKGKIATVWDDESMGKWAPSSIGKSIHSKSLDFIDAKALRIKAPVLFEVGPFAELFSATMSESFNLRNVQKGKSVLTGKKDMQIFSPCLKIVDHATLPYGVGSYNADFEGTKAHKTPLVINGVLKNYLSDYNAALHSGIKPTGNAHEKGISSSNIVVSGEFQELPTAILIESILGAHTSDPLSTSFSIKVDSGYVLRKGEKKPVKDFIVSGTFAEVLHNILSIGKNQKQRYGIITGAVATDAIKIIV